MTAAVVEITAPLRAVAQSSDRVGRAVFVVGARSLTDAHTCLRPTIHINIADLPTCMKHHTVVRVFPLRAAAAA